jgi:hypothetical protein
MAFNDFREIANYSNPNVSILNPSAAPSAPRSKEQILADSGIGVAGPSQNSTIGIAGQQFTPQPGKMGPLASAPTPAGPASMQSIRTSPNAAPLSSPTPPIAAAPAAAAPAGPAAAGGGVATGGKAWEGKSGPMIAINGALDPAAATAIRNRVDWSKGSVNAQNAAIDAKYKDEVAAATRINANNGLAPTNEQIKTLGLTTDQHMNLLNVGNKDGRFDKQIATLVTQAANEKSLAVENAKANAGIAGHQIAAAGQVAAANANAAGRIDAAKAAHAGDLAKEQRANAKDEAKNLHDILTNGYGVAPTKAAISAYKGHEAALDGWNKTITNYLKGYQKADPTNYPHVEKALLDFHRNPKDPNALKAVQQAGKLVQGGSDKMPDWFTQALKMPQFRTEGLQPWKNQMPVAGA